MSFVTQMLLTGDIAVFTYITNCQPQALVFAKNPSCVCVNHVQTPEYYYFDRLADTSCRGNKLEILGKIKNFFFVLKNNLKPLLHNAAI